MTVKLTPLAQSLMVGDLPRVGPARIRTLNQATGARVGTWARNRRTVSETGHDLWQKLLVDPRSLDEWRHIEDADPSQHFNKARNWVCTVYGGSTWTAVEQAVERLRMGDTSVLQDIQVVENHAGCDPKQTRLTVCAEVVTWVAAALLNMKIHAWVGFSAVRMDKPRFDQSPSMCGLTAELAALVE